MAICDLKKKANLTVYLSKLRSKQDLQREGARYYHFINHGFVVGERPVIEAFVADGSGAAAIDGFICRVVRQASPWADIATAGEMAKALDRRTAVHVRMTNPAEEFTDDLTNANRIAEALAGALTWCGPGQPTVDVFIDTFADIDRGYFVRNGLVDRRSNPRLASHVVRNLYGALNAAPDSPRRGRAHEMAWGHLFTLTRREEWLALVLPERKVLLERMPCETSRGGANGTARVIDLATGHVRRTPWQQTTGERTLVDGAVCATPTLIDFGG